MIWIKYGFLIFLLFSHISCAILYLLLSCHVLLSHQHVKMSVSKAVRLLTLPARLVISDPKVTGALLFVILYYPERLQSILPERVYQIATSPRFIHALKVFVGLGVVRMVNRKLSEYVVNNWKSSAKFIKSQEVVLITGGASGMGFLMAQEFSKMGTKVVVMDVSPPKIALRKLLSHFPNVSYLQTNSSRRSFLPMRRYIILPDPGRSNRNPQSSR
jgi:hypothetical protein